MISDFNILLIMLLRQLNFGKLPAGLTTILRLLQMKNSPFFNLHLLSEGESNPESCLAIGDPKASCL